jgi:hypothetical protein
MSSRLAMAALFALGCVAAFGQSTPARGVREIALDSPATAEALARIDEYLGN